MKVIRALYSHISGFQVKRCREDLENSTGSTFCNGMYTICKSWGGVGGGERHTMKGGGGKEKRKCKKYIYTYACTFTRCIIYSRLTTRNLTFVCRTIHDSKLA